MARLYLMRHARMLPNAQGRARGAIDPPLSIVGHQQAASLASGLAGVSFTATYTSDISRASETVAANLADRGITVRPAPALRELRNGLLVVGHIGSLRALLVARLGLPLEIFWSLDQSIASTFAVRLYPGSSVLECWNGTLYLTRGAGGMPCQRR